jgi:hypothetical protein
MSAYFYLYSHARIVALGYAPMSARQTLAETIEWLDVG